MKIFKLTLILFLALNYNALYSQTVIVKEQSKVTFIIGNFKIHNVEGSFTGMNGEISFNPNDIAHSNFNVCVDVSTLNTSNDKRDHHLKTADFFNVEKFPTICFQSLLLEKIKDGYNTTGNLTLHGITKKIKIPFTFDGKVFKGTINLKRLDYEIGISTSTFIVSDDVILEIICVVK